MTQFRVTERVTSTRVLNNMQASLQKLQNLQEQLSSGKQISKPSDDPSGAVSAMRYRSEQSRTEQYARNANDGIGWLGTADTTLSSSLTSIQRVRELLLQGANGTADTESRKALAQEIKTAKEALLGLANTTYQDQPIFAGTADPSAQVPPKATYDSSGNYNGNKAQIYRTVGPNAQVQVNVTGPEVFGDPSVDTLWRVLDDIQTHLTSGAAGDVDKLTLDYTAPGPPATAVQSDIGRLDGMRVNIQNRLSEIGARYHRVEQMQDRANDNLLSIQNGLSETENIDLPKTILAMQLQSTAYQTALSATAKVIQPSLVDFLS